MGNYSQYLQAAEQGDAKAMNELGDAYFFGEGVGEDKNEAAKWYRLAAEQGYTEAQVNLGCAYDFGEGVQEDKREAAKWYRLAAEQGHARAQFNLGNLYFDGIGVMASKSEANMWYRLAAEQGHAEAQFSLGLSYNSGVGVKKSFSKAHKWLLKAVEQGHPEANQKIDEIIKDYEENFEISFFLIFLFVAAILSSIGMSWWIGTYTKSSYMALPNVPAVKPAYGFKVGTMEDRSGFQFAPDEKDAFSLKDAMTSALSSALNQQRLKGAGYSVNVNILAYAPGRAGLRNFIPFVGATKLSIEALVLDEKGTQAVKIPVERRISSPGLFTAGHYEYNFDEVTKKMHRVPNGQRNINIFNEVAQEIVAVIKNNGQTNDRTSEPRE